MQTKSGLFEPCPNHFWQSANRFVPNANRHISAFQKRFANPFRNIHHLIMLITPRTLQIRIFGVAILGRVQVRPGSHGSALFARRLPPDDIACSSRAVCFRLFSFLMSCSIFLMICLLSGPVFCPGGCPSQSIASVTADMLGLFVRCGKIDVFPLYSRSR